MHSRRAEMTDYGSRHQDECRLSVDWADGKVRCWLVRELEREVGGGAD